MAQVWSHYQQILRAAERRPIQSILVAAEWSYAVNVVEITESNFREELVTSGNAIRDFLYMYFDIASDCLPTGDFARAELGAVDPYRYLDIVYQFPTSQFLSDYEINFLHKGAAVNLLCRLAQAFDEIECHDGDVLRLFKHRVSRTATEEALQTYCQDVIPIYQAFCCGRIVAVTSVLNAFDTAFGDGQRFDASLEIVVSDVILTPFN